MRLLPPVLALGCLAACVPADDAAGFGSVQFAFKASPGTERSERVVLTDDGWLLRFDRVVLGFKTMTIDKIGSTDVCAFRGRGLASDVVFDPRVGLEQTFNGIQAADCPDVGILFGPPGSTTTLGGGATSRDLTDLLADPPAHAIVEATATPVGRFAESVAGPGVRILLRFDPSRTTTQFGGCRAGTRGVTIVPGKRDLVSVRFAAERLFRDGTQPNAELRIGPFFDADSDEDGIVTMKELDAFRLNDSLGGAAAVRTLGDSVRNHFRSAFTFRDEDGVCVGSPPGTQPGN
jgi:hypothetical protein